MRTNEAEEIRIYIFIDLGSSSKSVVGCTPCQLYPEQRVAGSHSLGDWMDHGTCVEDREKLKFLTLPGLKF
jgi:hypothetical protein